MLQQKKHRKNKRKQRNFVKEQLKTSKKNNARLFQVRLQIHYSSTTAYYHLSGPLTRPFDGFCCDVLISN